MKFLVSAAFLSIAAPMAVQAAEPVAVPVEVAVGSSTSVMLRGNPTTGFVWAPASPLPADAPVRVEINIAPAKSGAPICGAPAMTVVSFHGVRPGSYTVRMVYARPWEKRKPANEAIFEVRVTK